MSSKGKKERGRRSCAVSSSCLRASAGVLGLGELEAWAKGRCWGCWFCLHLRFALVECVCESNGDDDDRRKICICFGGFQKRKMANSIIVLFLCWEGLDV